MTTIFKGYKLEEILLILFPLLLLSGHFFTDLSIIIIDIIFLIKIFKNKIHLNINKNLIYFFFFFFLIINITVFFSSDFSYYFFQTIPFVRFLIFPFALAYFLNKKIARKNKNIVLCIFLILFIDSCFQIILGKSLSGFELINNRSSSLFADEQILGSYTIRVLSFLIPMLIISEQKFNNFFFIILSLSILLVIMSKERVSIFFLIIYLVNIFFLINKLKETENKYFKLIFFSIFILTTLYFVDGHNIKNRFNQTVNELSGKDTYFSNDNILGKENKIFGKYYIFSSTHHNYLLTSYNIFKNNLLFGTGVKSYRIECKNIKNKINNNSCSTHPHNTYMQLLSEIGIFGTLPIVFLFIYVISYYFRIFFSAKTDSNKFKNIFFTLPVIISLFPIIPSGNFFNNYLASYYSFSLGIFIYYLINRKRN